MEASKFDRQLAELMAYAQASQPKRNPLRFQRAVASSDQSHWAATAQPVRLSLITTSRSVSDAQTSDGPEHSRVPIEYPRVP